MKRIQGWFFSLLLASSTCVMAQNTSRVIDEVVAIVDTSLVTKKELQDRLNQVEKQLKASNRAIPVEELRKQVLERLIIERIQLNLAREQGLRVTDKDLDRIIGNIAAQNKLTVDAFKKKIESEGIRFSKYREDIRQEVTISRLREREVDARIQMTEAEIDSFLSERNRGRAAVPEEIYLAQLLIPVPNGSSDAELEGIKTKVQELLQQASNEKDFIAFAKKVAQAGGYRYEDLGYRSLDRLPQIFIDAVAGVPANKLVGQAVRSGAGFHILKVVDRKGGAAVENIVVNQTLARHILIKHKDNLTDLEAQRRLNGFKDQIRVKTADFAQIAQKYSEDGSAANGGNLGWMSPGELVPAFEQAMNQLAIGEVSEPVRSEFGWHLIQVIDRRQAQLSADRQRDFARAALRERKLDQAYEDWIRQIRDAATVDIRQAN